MATQSYKARPRWQQNIEHLEPSIYAFAFVETTFSLQKLY